MANPLVSQGTLNRLLTSLQWQSFPSLNVTPSFLNRDGIRLALDGQSTTFLPSLTGAVTSPEPFMMATLTINLLKTQQLAALYKAQMELNTVLGGCTAYPDSTTLPPYVLFNCALESVREQSYAGEDAGWSVMVRGYYLVNSSLWP